MKFFFKNNKKAFTLTELIVAVIILSMVFLWIVYFVSNLNNEVFDDNKKVKNITFVSKLQDKITEKQAEWYFLSSFKETNFRTSPVFETCSDTYSSGNCARKNKYGFNLQEKESISSDWENLVFEDFKWSKFTVLYQNWKVWFWDGLNPNFDSKNSFEVVNFFVKKIENTENLIQMVFLFEDGEFYILYV